MDSSDYFVVYRPLYGDRQLVIRSWAEFVSTVNRNDEEVPRFRYLKPYSRTRKPFGRYLRRLLSWRKRRSWQIKPVVQP